MAKTSINLQDGFLNQVRRDGSEVTVVLVDGTSLRGLVRGFDNFTVVMGTNDAQHLIYKHAIAQVVLNKADARSPDHYPAERQERPSFQDNRRR